MGRKGKQLLFLCVFLLCGFALFRFPSAVGTGVSRGLTLCGNIIIPALFPFMVLTGVWMRSPFSDGMGRLLAAPVRFLFRLPAPAAGVIVFSMIGGYPSGAVALEPLLTENRLSQRDGARLMHFCVNAGPAFAVSAVGAGMLGDSRMGAILCTAHLAAALCIGIGEGLMHPAPLQIPAPPPKNVVFSVSFTEAVNSACRSLLYMCGFVILFCAALSVGDGSGLCALFDRVTGWVTGKSTPSLLSGLLEVTAGCMEVAGSTPVSVFLLGFFMGFGGLSVQCQVRAILSAYPAVFRRFFLFRVLHGMLGGAFSVLLCRVIPLPLHSLHTQVGRIAVHTVSPLASVALLGMSVTYLWWMQKKIAKCR